MKFNTFLFLGTLTAFESSKASNPCENALQKALRSFQQARSHEWQPHLANDLDILQREFQRSDGYLVSRFSNKFDTRMHRTLAGKVSRNSGEMPLVDPDTRGVFLFIHGSGTARANGRNFVDKMNALQELGYSSVGIDLPFHGDGPVNETMHDPQVFMKWLSDIVDRVKVPGKPIYLAGHSFGPDVILELATRYPDKVDGVVAISPAGFNKTLDDWYVKYTENMNFGGDVPANEAGGRWANIASSFQWRKGLSDPTKRNPKLKVRVLSGNLEEYVPGPVKKVGNNKYEVAGENTYDLCAAIKKIFSGATCTQEKGVGHYIFQHTDAQGQNVIMRELLAVDGKKPADIPRLTAEFKARKDNWEPVDVVAQRYEQDAVFRTWAQSQMSEKAFRNWLKNGNNRAAEGLMKKFDQEWLPQRYQQLEENIRKFAEKHPDFAAANKQDLEGLKSTKYNRTRIYSRYAEALKDTAK